MAVDDLEFSNSKSPECSFSPLAAVEELNSLKIIYEKNS